MNVLERNVFPKTRYILPLLIGLGLLLYGVLWWVGKYISESTYGLAEYSIDLVYVAAVLVILKVNKITLFQSKADARSILKTCILMVPALLFAVGSVALFSLMLPEIYEDEDFDVLVKFDQLYLGIVGFLSLAILAPFWEEVAFRGLILNRWVQKLNVTRAIVFSSLLFALFHPLDIIGSFLFGLVLAIQYLKTKNIFIAIIGHSFYNFILYTFFLISFITGMSEEPLEIPNTSETLLFGSICIAISLPILIYWLKKNWPKSNEVLVSASTTK